MAPFEQPHDDDADAPGSAVPTVPERSPSLTRELTRVEEANLAFYDAFRQRDLEKMSKVWSHSPHARCVHPGWELVIGWTEIRQSWNDIFRTIQDIDFHLEDVHIEVAGRTAWVNLVAHVEVETDEGDDFEASVVTTNIFEEIDDTWTLVLHHSSNFSEDEDVDEDELDLDGDLEDPNGTSGMSGAN
ncbi:nuclear transport factor 2 family protein [Myxococcota bacterium]|nr:nuclear transport factor 2 family protein [Myxococcota bacterium]